MSFKDTPARLSHMTVALHWIIAIAFMAMLAFGLYLEGLPRGPEKGALMGLHKSVGLIILGLAALRILWRLANGMPRPVGHEGKGARLVAGAVHVLLLIGTVMMPVSGILMAVASGSGLDIFGWELVAATRGTEGFVANEALAARAGGMHALGGWVMIGAVGLHIAAAIKHHAVSRDGTLRRMMGRTVGA
ncbi:putative cytochrome b561 [Roseibacterium elongatum DSM 19469]|uniref:Putative cytochrome b561 n=1 Tax=Roseicyclus elongatus DSM 19469 TaxID=1294273 RepID=W8RTW8_9RHOB|nr:cytochrome b [Roseibacterium elongatum]AHM04664.1 putative cytochrome b561 [Roseibacterium elongatum DSM 19469]